MLRIITKQGPPGPPPRPGLEWKRETHRWIQPETGETEAHHDWGVGGQGQRISQLPREQLEELGPKFQEEAAAKAEAGKPAAASFAQAHADAIEDHLEQLDRGEVEQAPPTPSRRPKKPPTPAPPTEAERREAVATLADVIAPADREVIGDLTPAHPTWAQGINMQEASSAAR